MAICNITVENDSDFFRAFAYQYTDGSPINLTGNTMRMGIRRHAADAAEEMLLTTENGGLVVTDAANGKFSVRLTQDQLVRLPVGDYEHSLVRWITATGEKYRIWSGTLTNNAGATR